MQKKQNRVQDIIDRMKSVLGYSKDAELASHLGIHPSTPAGWRTRGMVPIQEAIEIAVNHNISLDWLILERGKGPKLDQAEPGAPDLEPVVESVLEVAGVDEPAAASGVTLDNVGDVPGYVDLPVLDMATFNSTSNDSAWKVPRLWLDQEGLTQDETVMVRAAGDSMIPTIQEGQMVVIDRRLRDSDGVYLVRFRDSETVRFKRVQRMFDGSLRLSNDNPAYTVDVVPRDDVERIEFIGYCHASVQSIR